MSLADLTSREAVLEAIREYDQLGRDAFLQKYGFESAKRYYVDHDGKRYESKAIAGVAFGKQHPDRGALKSTEFTGGVGSVGRKLRNLGFEFVDTLQEELSGPAFGELLSDAMGRFSAEKNSPFGRKTDLWDAMNALKERLESYPAVRARPHIHCEWSLGQGNWLKVPWIALFDDRVTQSAQSGTYVVFLVSEDLSRVYVTLNQGTTEIEQKHGRATARQVLKQRANELRSKLVGLPLSGISLGGDIDLRTAHSRSKLYEDGTIAYVLHDPLQQITDAQLEPQLDALLTAYEAITHGHGAQPTGEPIKAPSGAILTSSTNLIFYGPPGTGKTYRTASKAVQLCDGALPDGGRVPLMQRYAALKAAGRIQFVTFHQSFGYEDFVEGLRPHTEAEEDQKDAGGRGFSLRPEPGIFKTISALAEQSGSARPVSSSFDLSGRRFYKMSLGRSADQSEIYHAAIEGGYVVLGYGGEHDWSDPKYDKWGAILAKCREFNPDISPNHGDVAQLFTLRGEMKRGDIVIVPDGNTKFRAIGEVAGDYEYVPGADEFRHRRRVRWLRVFEKSLPVDLIMDGRFSMMSLHRLDPTRLKLQALQSLIGGDADESSQAGQPEPYVLIIDEINRANISKVFGELITLLEPDKRLGGENELRVTLPYSKEEFGVPANLHIIGTMNTADRSIALLDTALRRRFQFEELMPDPSTLAEASRSSGVDLVSLLQSLNERIEYLFDRDHQIGHAYFIGCRTRADVDEIMRNKVIPLLSEYFYENWEKVWQVLGEPEASNDGAFLTRTKLKAWSGSGSEAFGQDRLRYLVRPEFSPAAYDQLS